MSDHEGRAVRSASFLSEKAEQVSPAKFVVFGIAAQSRYGKCSEVEEIFRFCRLLVEAGAATYVTEVFYDSKCGTASITYDLAVGAEIVKEIETIARAVFSSVGLQDGTVAGGSRE